MEHSDSDSFQEKPGFSVNNNNGLPRVQQDPSRSNSLMSETSSQPDIHPFFKVRFGDDATPYVGARRGIDLSF